MILSAAAQCFYNVAHMTKVRVSYCNQAVPIVYLLPFTDTFSPQKPLDQYELNLVGIFLFRNPAIVC